MSCWFPIVGIFKEELIINLSDHDYLEQCGAKLILKCGEKIRRAFMRMEKVMRNTVSKSWLAPPF